MKVFLIVALLLAVTYTPVTKYDPGRNADKDIKDGDRRSPKNRKANTPGGRRRLVSLVPYHG
jgi:hypothetical protein